MEETANQFWRIVPYVPSVVTVVLVAVGLWLVDRVLRRRAVKVGGHTMRDQLVMLGLTLAGLLLVIMALPNAELRGQLLSLVGILLSAAIALSSTTVLGNAMAGVMIGVVRAFRMGDFVRVGEHFGRVSERGLLHTEIQTADRELVTFPNVHLVTNPMTTIRSSGTIVSQTVSLGYDVPRREIEEALAAAAATCELKDPFVQILELGDFSVTYRVAGLLEDVKTLITTRSSLGKRMLDELHGRGIEIVSPTFMNTRAFGLDARFLPHDDRPRRDEPEPVEVAAESVAFDKAEEAEAIESLVFRLGEMKTRIEALKTQAEESTDEAEKAWSRQQADRLEARQERLAATIAERKQHKQD